ncbi:MAG: adenylyltransferase/cytidyltransferase family protein [Deltaproteobacteria bacterium]|nr:adenylyltransferase/cytidyltransferase family protein [Deltaproteobacteria bacterium]
MRIDDLTRQVKPNTLVPNQANVTSIEPEIDVPAKTDSKIKSKQEIINIAGDLRKESKKIVLTSGCFDILHIGHTRFLKKAKSYGDVLIVALNTDSSTRRRKGQGRPVNNQNDRAELLAELTYVDYIVLFNENTASSLISVLKPDTYVKGGDYQNKDYKNWPEAKIVLDYGGKVEIVALVQGRSSTTIINNC